jgi:DNA polymerase-1
MAERKKLAIIDGKSVFYRGYYAMPSLSTADGTPTGGVYGFAAMSLELIKKLKPDYVAVAWDKPKTNIRKRLGMYPAYKAGRKPAPPDFYAQIPILYDLLKAFSWPLYEIDDYEADDIMCTLAKKADKAGLETMLITSDLDALQCLSPHTHVYALKKGFSNIERFDPEYFTEKHGIDTDQFLDLKSLKGDSSDNIPGVPGIGEKTAVQLLQDYKTLDGIYKHLPDIKETVRKKLEAGKDSAYLSKKVALLMDDAPVDLDLKATDTHDLDVAALKTLLQKLEFRSLLRSLPEYMQVVDENAALDLATQPVADKKAHTIAGLKVLPVDSDAALKAVDLSKEKELIIHSFTAGAHGTDPKVLVLATNKAAYVFDIEKLDRKALISVLSPLLLALSVIGYDVKSSLQMLLELGIPLPKVSGDVLIGGFLIDPLRRARSLSEMAEVDIGYAGSELDDLTAEATVERAGDIAAVIRALNTYQGESISELTKLIQLADQIEWPIIPVLAHMEHEGIGLDTTYLNKMSDELEGQISDLEQTIYGHADQEFNISSPTQLADILYEKLSLPTQGVKRGKTGFSTAADELAKLRGLHPIIDLISEYREYTKLKSTYVDTLPKQVDKHSRVHTTFNLTIAPTGRLSSVDPNLQNIPVRTEVGKRIRTAFIAGKGNVFVSADYSQFELRLAAAMSGDEEMIKAFNEDQDIHQLTAAAVLGLKPEEVTKDLRWRAKAVNFGILYGQGPHGLAAGTGMSYAEARDFIAKYFEIRPKLKVYLDSLREQAKNKGFVESLLGRRRPTPDAQSSNHMVRETALRQAVNMPLQGTAADLTKLAMIRVNEQLPEGAKMLLQIHDSILIECKKDQADKVGKILKDTMENVHPDLGVKLKVDVSVGKNWGEL